MRNEQPRLGVDIGRVIIDGTSHPTGDDTAFFKGGIDNALATPAVVGSFAAIARLHELFAGHVWLVSKCGDRVERRTRHWLDHHRFYEQTGVERDHLRFCRQRADKAIHCAELGITHFVDDRPDVLAALDDLVVHRYLFGPQRRPAAVGVLHCPDWKATERAIRVTLEMDPTGLCTHAGSRHRKRAESERSGDQNQRS